MKIRLATLEDTAAVRRLLLASVQAVSSTYYSDVERAAWLGLLEATDLRELLDQETAYSLTVWRKEELCGFASLHDGEIRMLYVLPSAQGQGLGRRLYDMLEAEARDRGVQRLRLRASRNARPVYAAWGFVEEQTGSNCDCGGGVLCTWMSKSLTTSL